MSRPGSAWLLACLLLALATLLAPLAASTLQARLDWRPELALSQPWRWWTGALLHWNPVHLAANVAGLVLVAAFGHVVRVPALAVLAWLAAWPLTHLVLLLQPQLLQYRGLSGLLHAGITIVAVWGLFTLQSRGRLVAELVLVGLALKLLLEQPWATPSEASLGTGGWGFATAPLAHVGGAAAGLVCALLAIARGSGAERA